jgi:hypothetical protein
MRADLRAGLLMGIIAAAAIVAFVAFVAPDLRRRRGAAPRRGTRVAFPIAGLAIAAATLLALSARETVPVALLVAVVAAGAVCAIPPDRVPASFAAVLLVPFALMVAWQPDGLPAWVRVLVATVASAGAVAVARTEVRWRPVAITPALLAITAVAVLVAVPDTEEAAVLVGACLPVALLGWPLALATLGPAGAGACTVLVAWTGATGGRAAPAAVVGALAALGLLVGFSVGARVIGPQVERASIPPPRLPVVALAGQAVLALIASRVGAAHAPVGRAVVVAIIVFVASAYVGAKLTPRLEAVT